MSYILEALKKAQAERQLGNAPTIHAPQPVQAAAAADGTLAAGRKPLLLGLGAGVIVVAVGAALLWHRGPAPAPVVAASAPSSALPSSPSSQLAAVPAASGQAAASAAVGAGSAASATLAVRAPEAPPVAPAPSATARVSEARPPAMPARTTAGAETRAASALPPAAAPAQVQAQAAPTSAPSEDSLPLLQQLPESARAQIPRVNFGGYMYSANPADRLVLVDKGLRHEGEEVAPGLVLEKLLPHAAVMNFRGMRYRVAY